MSTTASNVGRLTTYYGTGAGALSETITPGEGFRVICVMLHLSAAPTTAEDTTITFSADQGASYATVLNVQAMAGITDYAWFPPADLYLVIGDSITVAWTNTDAVTWGLLVQVENV